MASGAPAATADDVIAVTETLIDAIGRGDYDTWKRMTSHDLTSFEPESQVSFGLRKREKEKDR